MEKVTLKPKEGMVEAVSLRLLLENSSYDEILRALQDDLVRLTTDQQRTLTLFFFEGYTLKEIGLRLNQDLEAIRCHYYLGLCRLREALIASLKRLTGDYGQQVLVSATPQKRPPPRDGGGGAQWLRPQRTRRCVNPSAGDTVCDDLNKLSDAELIDYLKSGSPDPIAILFARYRHLVFSISMKILRDATEAEDVVQDIFLEIWKKADRFDAARGTVKVWIIQYAYSRSLDRRRAM